MFRTILLPVDFEINTEMAVKKTLELSDPGQTVIHLFHVQKPAMPWSSIWGKDIFKLMLKIKPRLSLFNGRD